jgi:hypothetical protein
MFVDWCCTDRLEFHCNNHHTGDAGMYLQSMVKANFKVAGNSLFTVTVTPQQFEQVEAEL